MKNNILLWQVCGFIIISIPVAAISSCGDSPRVPVADDSTNSIQEQTPPPLDTVFSTEATGFEIFSVPSNPYPVVMTAAREVEILSVFISDSDYVEVSDTILMYDDMLQKIQLERIQMELDFALLHYDSTDANAPPNLLIDSLSTCVATFSSSANLLAEADGRVDSVVVSAGDCVFYGDTLLFLHSSGDSLFRVQAPVGWTIHHWPETAGNASLFEYSTQGAVYSGIFDEIDGCFSRIITIPRNALFEERLEVFVITVSRDTIPVLRIADLQGNITAVLPEYSIDEPLFR